MRSRDAVQRIASATAPVFVDTLRSGQHYEKRIKITGDRNATRKRKPNTSSKSLNTAVFSFILKVIATTTDEHAMTNSYCCLRKAFFVGSIRSALSPKGHTIPIVLVHGMARFRFLLSGFFVFYVPDFPQNFGA